MKKVLYTLLTMLALTISQAFALQSQESSSPSTEMADALRESGKIYVVVLVVIVLFTFLLAYLLITDRQVKKLEKEVKDIKGSKSV